ncbi:hypothetical protein RRG08_013913, partial [Elysia crispata]
IPTPVLRLFAVLTLASEVVSRVKFDIIIMMFATSKAMPFPTVPESTVFTWALNVTGRGTPKSRKAYDVTVHVAKPSHDQRS